MEFRINKINVYEQFLNLLIICVTRRPRIGLQFIVLVVTETSSSSSISSEWPLLIIVLLVDHLRTFAHILLLLLIRHEYVDQRAH